MYSVHGIDHIKHDKPSDSIFLLTFNNIEGNKNQYSGAFIDPSTNSVV